MTGRQTEGALEQLQRWEGAGAVWRVVTRSDTFIDVALMTCSAGEVVSLLRVDEPEALAFIADRDGSDS